MSFVCLLETLQQQPGDIGTLLRRQEHCFKIDVSRVGCHASKFAPNEATAYFNRSIAKQSMGDINGARADYKHYITLAPHNANDVNSGLVMLVQGYGAPPLI